VKPELLPEDIIYLQISLFFETRFYFSICWRHKR